MYCYINGQLYPQAEASLGVADLALLRGFGIFDYFVFEDQRPRFLDDYLDRFTRSALKMHLELPISREELAQEIHRLIRQNGQEKGGIRLLLTGGYTENGFTPITPNLLILQYPFSMPPAEQYEHGARIMTHPYQRELPTVKTINYLRGIWLIPELKAQQADYVLYHDGRYVRESDRSNFFLVTREGQLVTPAEQVLLGITRMKLLALARSMGIPTTEREVALAELEQAQECFISSSLKGALPITSIDGKAVGDGKPGPISRQLQQAFLDLVQRG
jgi:branched-subunit amino acid aminotransferase/4-amino-4-deoxychorismate lyase